MTPKKKIFLISLIFGLAAIALIIFVIFPLLEKIRKNSGELLTAKKELILSEEQNKNIVQIKKIYEETEPDFEKIESIFIDPAVPIDLIKFFEKTAESSEVLINISSMAPKTSKNEPWNYLGFQLVLTGDFPNFCRFLEKIEGSYYLIEVQNMTVRRLNEQELKSPNYGQFSAGSVSAALSIKVYTN